MVYFYGRNMVMVKEHTFTLMELCVLENSRMGKEMVKENLLHLMERSMKGNGRKGNMMG
jgi:hypothetical protein